MGDLSKHHILQGVTCKPPFPVPMVNGQLGGSVSSVCLGMSVLLCTLRFEEIGYPYLIFATSQ